MGGNSATQQQQTTPAASGFPSGPGTYQMQPAPPGMLDQFAAALAAGYGGGGQNAQRAYLDQIYKPMTFPSFNPVGAQVSAPTAAPAAQTGGLGASSWRVGIDPVGMPQS